MFEDGEPVGDVFRQDADIGDPCRVTVEGDFDEQVHIHGYDLYITPDAADPTLEFDAADSRPLRDRARTVGSARARDDGVMNRRVRLATAADQRRSRWAEPLPAGAHGIGGRTDLPLPAWQLAWAAGFAVASSFVALGAFWATPRLGGCGRRSGDVRSTDAAFRASR